MYPMRNGRLLLSPHSSRLAYDSASTLMYGYLNITHQYKQLNQENIRPQLPTIMLIELRPLNRLSMMAAIANPSSATTSSACRYLMIWGGGVQRMLLSLTPRLTGAGARSAQGTNSGHENAEGMPAVCVRVEPTVRLRRVGRDWQVHSGCVRFECPQNVEQAPDFSRLSALPAKHLFFDEVVHQVREHALNGVRTQPLLFSPLAARCKHGFETLRRTN